MKSPWKSIRNGVRPLTVREIVMAWCLAGVVVVFGAGRLLEGAYREPRRELAAAVAAAEDRVRRNAALLSREDRIHERFASIEAPRSVRRDSALTETDVLKELSDLAGKSVRVRSIVPRMANETGASVMHVSLDFEGPFEAVVGYVEKILDGMPSTIGSLSLSPVQGAEGGVVCRMSIRVGGFDAAS